MKIESRIDGEFNGTDNEVVYTLWNGQVWQQVGYSYRYHYMYAPSVTIESCGSQGVMTVDGFDQRINVRRLA